MKIYYTYEEKDRNDWNDKIYYIGESLEKATQTIKKGFWYKDIYIDVWENGKKIGYYDVSSSYETDKYYQNKE